MQDWGEGSPDKSNKRRPRGNSSEIIFDPGLTLPIGPNTFYLEMFSLPYF